MNPSLLTPHPSPGVFVTGTDTGCGKTLVAAGMLHRLRSRGVRAVGMKPVASGCEDTKEGLRNEDALLLQSESSFQPAYEDVNPYAFAPPIAPHVAAAEAGVGIDIERICECQRRLAAQADYLVMEGVGGWAVPLGPKLMLADLARAAGLPVVLVVGLRLGCLNHAQLAARAISDDGCKLAGWIANAVDPDFERVGANLQTLRERLAPAPCLGVVDFHDNPTPADIAAHLRPDKLMAAGGYRQADSSARAHD